MKGEDFWKRRENGKEISFESGRNVWTRRLLDEAVVVLRKTKLTTYLYPQVHVYTEQIILRIDDDNSVYMQVHVSFKCRTERNSNEVDKNA